MMGRKETIMCTSSDVDVVLLLENSPDPPRSHYCGLPDGNLRINRPKSHYVCLVEDIFSTNC